MGGGSWQVKKEERMRFRTEDIFATLAKRASSCPAPPPPYHQDAAAADAGRRQASA
jgi:hypothetical protein